MGIVLSLLSRQESKVEKLVKQALGNDETLYAFPDEPFYAYDHVKLYNLDIPTRPAAVTYPKTPQQIEAIVKAAAKVGLAVQAKSGGHSYCNFSSPDGGIIVDLRNFKKFSMDTKTWRATAGGGMLLGELTEAMYNPHKRAMAHGTCPQVGIGGHATIGGLGPSSRLFGAALDHVLEVQVVTADGQILRANETQHPDLFWALKGAGASFGVITEFVLRTEPAPRDTVQYKYSFTSGSWGEMAAVFKSWQRFIADPELPREFATTATITALGLTVSGTFYGSEEDFEQLSLKPDFPLRHTGEKTAVSKNWMDVLTHQAEEVALKLGGGISAQAYTKTLTFGGSEQNLIPDETVDKLFDHIERADKGTLIWFLIFDLAGGKVNDFEMKATAYAHRDALYYLQSYAISDNIFNGVSRTTKDFLGGISNLIVSDMKADGVFTEFGAYPGYVDLELGAGAQAMYWRSNLPRLEEIKADWDPTQVFRNPQSVRPARQRWRSS
ncbi:hypothetical protein LTR37_012171 [Vermiconidia calcicola]|uniref:Uncharacterized protein n=1 Tax=Vermiconidia calcicola TaxID=1690605 RepID=A0ACC3MZY3_9PEZI|nr:hypothetical protein LTR37_012171 [Vermiconidia calcicola]